MSRFEKLKNRLYNADATLSFNELRKILERYGYVAEYPRGGSSHCTFRKPGCFPVTIPRHVPVGQVYIKAVRSIVEKEKDSNE